MIIDWESHFSSGSGTTIHYRVAGNGPPLLLLNGMAASGRLWPAAWLERLVASFRVLAMDNRGTGGSAWRGGELTISDMAGDALAVLDDCDLESAHVLGHSMGGMVAQALAVDHPERVRSLVLCATLPGRSGVPTPPETLAQMPRPNAGTSQEPAGNVWRVVTAPGFADLHPEVIQELVDQQAAQRPSPEILMAQVRAAAVFDSAPHLASVRTPTLVLHGEADPQIPVENGRLIARHVPGARLEILSGVGHLVAYEAAERCAQLIEEFVTATERPVAV